MRATEFGERLAPVGERRFDDAAHPRDRSGHVSLECDESGVDARPRTEDGRRYAVEADLSRRELDEHGDGTVGLRPRAGEEAIGDLPLHHHAPAGQRVRVLERLDDEGRSDVVREVRDELARDGVELADREPERVAPEERDVGAVSERVEERRLERAVELDGVHEADTIGEEAGKDAEARARPRARRRRVRGRRAGRRLRGCSRRRGSAGRATSSARRSRQSKCGRRVRVRLHSEVLDRLAALLGEHAQRVHDVRGLVRRAADCLRGEVRAVGLDEEPVAGDRRGRGAQVARLRVRDDFRRTRRSSRVRRQRIRAQGTRSSGGRRCRGTERARPPSRRPPRGCGRRRADRARRRAAAAPRRAVAARSGSRTGERCRVPSPRPRLPSGGRADRGARRGAAPRARRRRADRCRAQRRRPRARRRDCERRPARLDAGADRDDARDTGRPGALDERGDRPVARVEMRVRVGHAAAASIRASSSSTTRSASSFTKSGRGSRSSWPGGSAARLPAARPRVVLAGEDHVLVAVLVDGPERERAGDDVVVPE